MSEYKHELFQGVIQAMRITIDIDSPYEGDIIIRSDNLMYHEATKGIEGYGMQCAVCEDKEAHYEFIRRLCEDIAHKAATLIHVNQDKPIEDLISKTEIKECNENIMWSDL